LETGPLFRVSLYEVSEAEHLLLLNLHHSVADDWTLGVLGRELSGLYEAHVQGRRGRLNELAVQYGDYARWQREWLGSGVLAGQREYWREQLAGLTRLELPTDRVRPSRPSHAGATVVRRLRAGLGSELRRLGQQEEVTLFMTLLAGFQALLLRYTGQRDVAVG